MLEYLLIISATLAVGLGAGYFIRKSIAEAKIASAEVAANKILEEANLEASAIKREKHLEAKEEAHRLRHEIERESKERRADLQRVERRLQHKEENLDRKISSLERKEEELRKKEEETQRIQDKIQSLYRQQLAELERVSALTRDEARDILLKRAREEITHEMAIMVKEVETQAKVEADKKAREVVTMAIQKCAADHVTEATVSVVSLPNDEMKGRIIGREGRNIRTLETLTGIDLIIDDTPEAVILSGFDPIRREIARIALEKLISDGRIHPARIEEIVEKTRKEVEVLIKEEGERATFETGVHGIHPELVLLLGKLRYRTSYGQNVLQHSIEVAHLAATMAAELGLDINFAKRAGLLHDIGKALDHETEGSHVLTGAEIAKRYKETADIINAIEAHHGDIEFKTLEAVLIQSADAVSAARPGARRESLEVYIKRLEKLEQIADSFDGVDKSYAIHAGREIRIIVKPEKIDDYTSIQIARDIVKKIESDLEYPGQIKVTVIRETRAVDYAR
ncbi:MAG: ribonuclease Y [Dethiobacter sp.]|jgi:ribonuclease Y|nr:ribonuclease Y [Dethiobacter sp.]